MKRFFAKIGRFFWSWTFLKFVLAIIALVIFFYVEEDWRGARAWAATQAEWEAKGESFDYNKFSPPPIPDDQNLAALPLFKLEMVKNYDGRSNLAPVVLQQAMRSDLPSLDLPSTGNWMRGELPDMAKIRNWITTGYAYAFKNTKPPEDMLAQFNAVYPFLTDFLAASATRPVCRFNEDYSISPPLLRSFGPLTRQIKLSRILTLHAILALDHHQPDLALEDIKTNYKLASGAKHDPSFVGGLVAIGMTAINNAALYDGLAQHAWSDAQLAELERTLEPMNFLADYQFAMRSEVAQSTANLDYFKRVSRSELSGLFQMWVSPVFQMIRSTPPWPNGWWDKNMSQLAAYHFHEMATVDPQSRLVYPKVDLDLEHQVEREAERWDANAPWNIWFTLASSGVLNITLKYANGQVWLDEARIACAIERYHLAHGVYPGSLDGLAPAYIDELPHDIMNGQPYHYQLRPDGTYLLYSVGWNQIDDGGKVVYKNDNPNQIDYTQGDWVWPTPQLNPQK